MNDLLDAIEHGWNWKLGKPVAIVATNRFGNAIVRNEAGEYFLIMPEEWKCDLLARSTEEFEEKRKKEEFIRDWEMALLVGRAQAAHGCLAEGEVYFLVVPGILGGKYVEENIRKIPLAQLLAYSGDMAQQIDDVPDGETVMIVPTEKEPNKTPEPTTMAVTPRAPSSTSRASHGRGSS